MDSNETRQLTEALSDATAAMEGVGFEVEALNQTLRELLSVAEVGLDLEVPPSWVNEGEAGEVEAGLDQGRDQGSEAGQYPPPERARMGSAAGVVVLSAILGCLLLIATLVYFVSS